MGEWRPAKAVQSDTGLWFSYVMKDGVIRITGQVHDTKEQAREASRRVAKEFNKQESNA